MELFLGPEYAASDTTIRVVEIMDHPLGVHGWIALLELVRHSSSYSHEQRRPTRFVCRDCDKLLRAIQYRRENDNDSSSVGVDVRRGMITDISQHIIEIHDEEVLYQ
jgi:hypothetical protein